jgi:capsular polysaccharide biosynthesis protein
MNKIIQYFLKKFKVRYKVTVSFNKEYGDSDDKVYITKKILIKKNNHLKFVNENNVLIEYRSASGLNYIIENC